MARTSRRGPARPEPKRVSWRDGVHLTGTPIWCDARRRRDVCFVSSADRVGRAGHGQLIATPLTLALLGAAGGGHLGVPLHRRFTLGTHRLELLPSGRGPGAAALRVELGGGERTVLYAGPVRVDDGAGPGAEVRAADVVVVAAPFGEPRHRFPRVADAIAQTLAWARAQLAAGRRPILLVDSALDALEVGAHLAAGGLALAGAHAIRALARRAAEAAAGTATAAGSTPPIAALGREPRATLWLERDRAQLARAVADHPHATALVSGRALDGARATDAAFAWSHAAGRAELLAWIEATRAKEIAVTGACAEAIAAALGPRARVIGPPHQMTLFPPDAGAA